MHRIPELHSLPGLRGAAKAHRKRGAIGQQRCDGLPVSLTGGHVDGREAHRCAYVNEPAQPLIGVSIPPLIGVDGTLQSMQHTLSTSTNAQTQSLLCKGN